MRNGALVWFGEREQIAFINENLKAEPGIIRAYLFLASDEIRVIYVDPTATPIHEGDAVAPFYFGPDTSAGITYRSALGLIRPEELEMFDPPPGWGTWESAIPIEGHGHDAK